MTATVATRTVGTIVEVTVSGEIDLHNAGRFEGELAAAAPNAATLVRVDLSDVSYIDSAGIRAIVLLASRLRTAQIELELSAAADSLPYRVIEMSGLSSLIGLRSTPDGTVVRVRVRSHKSRNESTLQPLSPRSGTSTRCR